MDKKMVGLALGLTLGVTAAWAGVEDTDYDGDRRSDFSVYHARLGTWYVRHSANGQPRIQNWGWNQSQPVAGDFDGDGKADLCVYEGRSAKWFVLRSSDQQVVITEGWGSFDQDPVAGDFDGDGKNDLSLYHPPSGAWHVLMSRNGERVRTVWGFPDTEPVPGDYDGDGKTDIGVYSRGQGNWIIISSLTGLPIVQNWGWSEAEPVQGDYDGDGKTDIAVFHAAVGRWFIRLSSQNGALKQVDTGWVNAQPVQADYDGDGKTDIAVYDAPRGNWLVVPSRTGIPITQNWGWYESEPSAAAYRVDDDGKHYNHSYGHDYDDDAFESNGAYPRTGARAGQVVTSGKPSTPSTPATGLDAVGIKPSEVKWLTSRGRDYSKAKVIMEFKNVSISASRCYFKTNPGIPWPERDAKNINGVGLLIRNINGRYIGGKCEWLVGSRGWFDVRTNVRDGYNGHTLPVSGETVWVGIGNPDNGTEVSQLVPTRWP